MLPSSPHAAGDLAAAGGIGLCYFHFEDGYGGHGLGRWPDLADLRSALEPLLLPKRRKRSAESRMGRDSDSSCAESADCDAVVPRAAERISSSAQV